MGRAHSPVLGRNPTPRRYALSRSLTVKLLCAKGLMRKWLLPIDNRRTVVPPTRLESWLTESVNIYFRRK